MIRRPPRSTLSPTRRSSDLRDQVARTLCKQVQDRLQEGLAARPPPLFTCSMLIQLLRHICLPLVYRTGRRSEEHTSELQSRQYLVCRLLLEKKKKHNYHYND